MFSYFINFIQVNDFYIIFFKVRACFYVFCLRPQKIIRTHANYLQYLKKTGEFFNVIIAYLSYLQKTGETGKKTPAEAGVDDGSMRVWGSYSGVSLG